MTTRPATSAAEYAERTRDENKARELHPDVLGSLDLNTMRALPRADAKAIWAQASDSDKRGLAIQCIRHGNHGPDEEIIAMYLDILEGQLGLSEVEAAVSGALERLATDAAQSARTARKLGLEEAAYHQRSANAYVKALSYYRAGVRPEPTQTGWMLPSQRTGEAPHLLTKDGDWVCTCSAGESMHWAKALIVGIEVGYDDLAGAGAAEAQIPEDTGPDDFSDVGPERAPRLDDEGRVASLVARLAAARAKIAA